MLMPPGAILLGYGGSQHSRVAFAWADLLAAQLDKPLHVLVSTPHSVDGADAAAELDRLVADAAAHAVSTMHVLNPPGEALVREGGDAHLTVLGARTQGPLKSMVTGSVSQYVARHATGPVVIVREPHTRETGTIVVGIDGSAQSLHALEFAQRHAGETGATVKAIHARPSRDAGADARVDGTVDIGVAHVDGSPTEVLAEASREADLLVIGTRGRSALQSFVLGSVTQEMLQVSQCPVAIVR